MQIFGSCIKSNMSRIRSLIGSSAFNFVFEGEMEAVLAICDGACGLGAAVTLGGGEDCLQVR